MKKKNVKLIIIALILLFTFNIVNEILNISEIPVTEYKNSDKDANVEKTDEEIVDEEIFKEDLLKTSNFYESNLSFSFDIQIDEIANQSWSYVNYNATNGGFGFGTGTDPMMQYAYNGSNASFEFYITGLINASSPTKVILRPNDIGPMSYISLKNFPPGSPWEPFPINDNGPGKGNCSGYLHLNDTIPFGVSTLTYTHGALTNITYNATLTLINAISKKTVKTTFIPTIENTRSDFIEWEMKFDNKYFFNFYGQWQQLPDEYKARIELNNSFIISTALGKTGAYWNPLNYDRNSTHLTIYGSYEEYKINFYSPNLISATFNDNLTIPNIWTQEGKNELHLNVTCKMEGNLTIRFTDSNGTSIEESHNNVKKNEIISYNYIMLNYSKGGIGFLNITLVNGSDVYFGVKLAEIAFHKRSQIIGFTSNTTAFEPNFYLGAIFIDTDYTNYLASKGYNLGGPYTYWIINQTMIPNATVTYKLIDYSGELPFIWHPDPSVHIWIYLKSIDLRELQITPEEYNITFAANQPGYESSVFVVNPFVVWKRNVTINLQVTDDILEIEESFSFTVNLKVNYTNDEGILYMQENFLRVPVQVNLSFINNKTGEVDGPHPWGQQIVQSFSLYSEIENDTIPGIYIINITIISNYYQGSAAFPVKIIRKPLTVSLAYDEDDLVEDEEFELSWALENGHFAGNPENMTLEIYLDGILHSEINLGSGSSGITKFELDEGDYTLTYRIVSLFYTAETSVKIEIEKEKEPESSWLEENWIWLVIGVILLVAFAIFATFMVISRHKIKVKRGFESELITLKNRISSTETAINKMETQIAQIASIFWILVVHSEQGTTMAEIDKFYFEKILSENQLDLIGKGEFRDSALIGGFLSAIRNFSRETSGTSMASQPIFNSETDYSTVVDNMEIHRRILEGTNYFMAFVSTKPTSSISDVLSGINSLFEENYGEEAKKFLGSVAEFIPFRDEVPKYLHEEIRKLQKELMDQQMLIEHYGNHLNQVQDKIGIKPKKIN